MMTPYIFAIAFGFIFSGLLSTFYQCITQTPVKLELKKNDIITLGASIVLTIFATPYIVMRNALKARIINNRHIAWLLSSLFVATVWSFFSGVVLLSTWHSVFHQIMV